jgi:hypothetical protein
VVKDAVQLPAFYTMRALGELGRVSPWVLRRLLRECGVRRVRVGQVVLIPVAELKKKVPLLFESLQVVESMRRRREQGKCRS